MRKKIRPIKSITFRGPPELGGVYGAFAGPELLRGLRVGAVHLRAAIREVGEQFSAEEWSLLARALEDRVEQLELSPDAPDPGKTLAAFVEQGLARLGLQPEEDEGGKTLPQRVGALTHLQSWAVVIAVDFEFRQGDRLEDGTRWWEEAGRWAVLRGDGEDGE